MDALRHHTIREQSHRILDPFTDEQLATLGRALRLPPGATLLDLACGKGELLCTWARDHGTVGTGVDLNPAFVAAARERAAELGVDVTFVEGDAGGYVVTPPVDVAACVGATWIGGGLLGTLDLLARSLTPGGIALVGEPFWRCDPPEAARAIGDFRTLPGLVAAVQDAGWDVVEMVLADEDSWDRYVAAQWLNLRRFLDEHPDDELAPAFREELSTAPLDYVTNQRPYLGWGVLALMRRP
ncbi:SAM-dependent methyltransferase [Cellulomonas fengjieae]|uniref:Methyltransferase domain-containing protein n=1 Tax=Cellulomonas fengjieae TaxID=2819978 RepID=A0ABS3SKF2_9CELL|nr:class I SAM-dependent methyltransferase [Cellulomonas fengjieae]MBO3086229.1 methyltransferase domain-containing protein [Cellulomonas fengjieae]QVI65722.1 methyltransferase domain-containing protein [Cellulomonas fengjieae]